MNIYRIILVSLLMVSGPVMTRAAEVPFGTGGKPVARQYLKVALGRGEALVVIWIEPLDLWVGQFEVTNGQYRRFDPNHVCTNYFDHSLDGADQPVVMVAWEEAANYCGWLNRNFSDQIPAGRVFRLPTEKEWETYARCGAACRFPWGNYWPPPDDHNYRGEEGIGLLYQLIERQPYIKGHNDGFIVSAPVTASGRNRWGLYGVGGNVWEWCQDWRDNDQTTRVLRGGGWNNYEPNLLVITNRSDANPDWKNAMIGFRVVIGPKAQ